MPSSSSSHRLNFVSCILESGTFSMKYLFRIVKALSQVSLGFGQSKVPLAL